MTSTLPPFVQASSGALGAASANTLSYPLDVITTRVQTGQSKSLGRLLEKHGLLSLYDGIGSDTGATLLSSGLYYYAYSYLRSIYTRRIPKGAMLSVPQELAIGYLAGIASRAITTPLNCVTVRLQIQRDADASEDSSMGGFTDVVKQMYEESGFAGFWKGFQTTFLLSLNPAISLLLFQIFRRVFLRGRDRDMPTPGQSFVGGAVASSIAVTMLYPLILTKTLIQAARAAQASEGKEVSVAEEKHTMTVRGVLTKTYREGGAMALYRGLQSQILKGIITQGVALMVKQRIEQIVVQAYLRRKGLAR